MKTIITERVNLFEPNVYISMCVQLVGKIDPSELLMAVKKAIKANESTMSKIVLNNSEAFYENILESGCKVEIVSDNKTIIELIKINEKIPFAIDNGELIRTFIVPYEDKTELLIMAHHLVGDGKSIIYFVKDIMNALAGIPLTFKPLTLLEKNLPPRKLRLDAKLYSSYCNKKWKNHLFSWNDYYSLHKKYWDTNSSDIKYEIFSVEKTQEIKNKAKQIGCSVNSFIVTMLLKKYPSRHDIGIPVSIREKGNESMSNLTSGILLRYKYNFKKSFEENAKEVHKKITEELNKDKVFALRFIAELPMSLVDAVLLNTHGLYDNRLAKLTAKVMGYSGKKVKDMGISNLTVLDIPTSYRNYEIDNIIFIPPAISYSHNIIGVSTINEKMTITYHNVNKC